MGLKKPDWESFTLLYDAIVVPVYTYDATTQAQAQAWKAFHFLVLVLMLASLRRTCKPGRRKRKHKRKHKVLMLTSHRFTCRFLVLVLMLFFFFFACVVRVNQAFVVQMSTCTWNAFTRVRARNRTLPAKHGLTITYCLETILDIYLNLGGFRESGPRTLSLLIYPDSSPISFSLSFCLYHSLPTTCNLPDSPQCGIKQHGASFKNSDAEPVSR